MASKPKRLPPYKLPRCDGSDGDPTPGSAAAGTFRCCRALATYRVEWTQEIVKKARSGFRWELRAKRERSCERHLPALLERVERAVEITRSPYHYPARDWSPADVPDPTLTRLEFPLDKRAKAHGNCLYIPVETPLTGPVEFKLF